jgi:hypothetical protein
MVTKSDLKIYDFDSLYGYFDLIHESKINGNGTQAIELIADLSKPQSVQFVNYLNHEKPSKREWLMDEILKHLKK